MSATLTPHYIYNYVEGNFEISIISFYDFYIPVMCLVFYKSNYLRLQKGLVQDAIIIDENTVELEVLFDEDLTYFYYYADSSEYVDILAEDSEILFLRKCNEQAENMGVLVHASEEIFEQAPYC